ncbi:MAG TPA: acyltransferase [Bryobacteraceae bacterium]|nr:acyltransferase [Bryobacteraceae bacterium]
MKVKHSYYPAFDVFRGLAIICVMLAHTPGYRNILDPIRPLGVLGVHMFFAMSGFLITFRFVEEHEQTGRIDLRAFYKRRVRRIIPPAVIYLSLLTLLGPALHKLPVSKAELAAALLFYRNIYIAPAPNGWYTGHFWSLSLEEQFYMAWPLLLAMLGPRTKRARLGAIGIIAATIAWRIHVTSVDPSANVYRPDLLADHLVWGCLIALLWRRITEKIPARARAVIGVIGIVAAVALLYEQPMFWQPLFAMCVAGGFIFAAETSEGWCEKLPPLKKLGEASYDCYIWQSLFLPLPFPAMALPWAQRVPWGFFCVAIATSASFLLTYPKRRRSAA